jgi:hypothetical protein
MRDSILTGTDRERSPDSEDREAHRCRDERQWRAQRIHGAHGGLER